MFSISSVLIIILKMGILSIWIHPFEKKNRNELYNAACDCHSEPTLTEISDTEVDIFSTTTQLAALTIFFLNYTSGTSESVPSLAHDDSWFTARTWLVSHPDGKGW